MKEIKYIVTFLRDDEEEPGGKKVVMTGEFASEEEVIKGLGPFRKAVADCEVDIREVTVLSPERIADIMGKI